MKQFIEQNRYGQSRPETRIVALLEHFHRQLRDTAFLLPELADVQKLKQLVETVIDTPDPLPSVPLAPATSDMMWPSQLQNAANSLDTKSPPCNLLSEVILISLPSATKEASPVNWSRTLKNRPIGLGEWASDFRW